MHKHLSKRKNAKSPLPIDGRRSKTSFPCSMLMVLLWEIVAIVDDDDDNDSDDDDDDDCDRGEGGDGEGVYFSDRGKIRKSLFLFNFF